MTLSWNRHGKSGIRLVKVRRPEGDDRGEPHEIVDLTIDVQLEGAFAPVYVEGDNTGCLATDTMKNTVYAFARQDPIDHVESFVLRLAEHFAGRPLVERVRMAATEQRWERLVGGWPPPSACVRAAWRRAVDRRRHARRAGRRDRVRPDEPRGAEDDRFGVRRFSARRVHDAPRHRRSRPRDVDDGVVDVSPWHVRFFSARPDSRGAPRDLRGARQPIGPAYAVRDGRGGAGGVPRHLRHHVDHAQPASPAGQSRAVRARQPERRVRRDGPALLGSSRRPFGDNSPMAIDLSTTFTGMRFENPFLLSSAPPTESESNILRAFDAGLGRRRHEDDRPASGGQRRRAQDEVPARRRRFAAPVDEEASGRGAALVLELGAHLRQDARLVGAAPRAASSRRFPIACSSRRSWRARATTPSCATGRRSPWRVRSRAATRWS